MQQWAGDILMLKRQSYDSVHFVKASMIYPWPKINPGNGSLCQRWFYMFLISSYINWDSVISCKNHGILSIESIKWFFDVLVFPFCPVVGSSQDGVAVTELQPGEMPATDGAG